LSLLTDYARDRFPEVAAKAPSEALLEAYMRDRFPELAAKADATQSPQRTGPPGPMGKYGGLPGDQADLQQPLLERFGQAMTGNAVDYAKSAYNTIVGNDIPPETVGGQLGQFGANVGIGAGKGIIDTFGSVADLVSGGRGGMSPDLKEALEPQNMGQQTGQLGERIAEFALPAGGVTKGVKALTTAKKIGTVGSVGLNALGQAGVAGGMDLLHGEDVETAKRDAAIAAAFPIVGSAVNKLMKTASARGVDKFFKQTTAEKRKGFEAGVSETMQAEGITGLRAQALKDAVETKINTLKGEIADELAQRAPKTPWTVNVSKIVDGELDKSVRLAKAAYNEAAGRLTSAKDAIRIKIDELSRNTGVLDLVGLDQLRSHISGPMMQDAGYGMYRKELLRVYNYTRNLLTANAPSVGAKLTRESNLINVSSRISQKIEELDKKTGSMADLMIGGVAGAVGGPVGTVAGALAGGNAVRRAFQYTPGRMMLSKTQRGMGTMAGLLGTLTPAAVVGYNNTGSVPNEPFAPEQDFSGAPAQISGPVGQYTSQIETAAQQANVDPLLLAALVSAESAGNPNAKSNKGAVGLTQMTPIALKEIGMTKDDIKTPEGQLLAGAKYLRLMLDQFNGNPSLALAAYNAGPSAVTRHKGIPPFKETQAYVPRVLRFYSALGGAEPVAVGGL
jgi:hypothetical protein